MLSTGSLIPNKLRRERKRTRAYWLKRAYGWSEEKYEEQKLRQRGICAICAKPLEVHGPRVDHIKGTKVVRGIICNHCNLLIGHAFEDPWILRQAALYLAGR